jgi:hypothetical protein
MPSGQSDGFGEVLFLPAPTRKEEAQARQFGMSNQRHVEVLGIWVVFFPEEPQKPPKHFPIVLPQLGNETAEINVVIHDALGSPPHTTSSGGGGFRRLVKKAPALAARALPTEAD